MLAPSDLAATPKTNTVEILRRVVEPAGKLMNLRIRGLGRHRHNRTLEEVFPVIREGTHCRRVGHTAAWIRKACTHYIEDIVVGVLITEVVKRNQPAALAPKRCFIRTDRDDIERVASGGNVNRQTPA